MKNAIRVSEKRSTLKKFSGIAGIPLLERIALKGLCLLFLLAAFNLQAQEPTESNTLTQDEYGYVVKGIVVDEENQPLNGVNIVLKGTSFGIVSDLDGNFEFPRKLKVDDTLVFSYIGYGKKEYTITKSKLEVQDVQIAFDTSDITLMGALEVEGVYSSKRNIFQKFIAVFR